MDEARLEVRFIRNLATLGVGESRRHLLIAFSGGLDSTVLLHLLRFHAPADLTLTAAHLDHRMRESSGPDAGWVRGVCRAWGVPLLVDTASGALRSEAEARSARYLFLVAAASRSGADCIVTAHHADDQAETVLFRIARGTGLPGLGGIPRRTSSGLLRPLLPFWRKELEEYAHRNCIRARLDPTNIEPGAARNRIRLNVLPLMEREVNGSVKKNLVALAALARESEAGWRSVVADLYARAVETRSDALLVARTELRRYHPALATRVMRRALRQFGIVLDRPGTRSLLKFITDAPSGREMHLPGGVEIRIEFDRARIAPARRSGADVPLEIRICEPGTGMAGSLILSGRRFRVQAFRGSLPEAAEGSKVRWRGRLHVGPEHFPLLLRSRKPGDRVLTRSGTKTVKKLMIEQRVPVTERSSRPILVDANGAVLWIAGIEVSVPGVTHPDRVQLDFTISDD